MGAFKTLEQIVFGGIKFSNFTFQVEYRLETGRKSSLSLEKFPKYLIFARKLEVVNNY
jgi:hypothetical protein